MRADQLLLQRGLASSRSQAQRLIGAGVQWREHTAQSTSAYRRIVKNSDEVPDDAQIELLDSREARYVSRGGLKLEGALRHSGLLVTARYLEAENFIATGADGLSCVGNADDSVIDAEVRASEVSFDLIVGDLAFISQTLVMPACVPFLRSGGAVLMLVKPQFELQPGQVGKGGIVRDESLYADVEQRIRGCYAELGLIVRGWYESPILGGDGNREFFVCAEKPQGANT